MAAAINAIVLENSFLERLAVEVEADIFVTFLVMYKRLRHYRPDKTNTIL